MDGLAHAEAEDQEWSKGLKNRTHEKVMAIMIRILEELDDGKGHQLANAGDEWASFNLEENHGDEKVKSGQQLANAGDEWASFYSRRTRRR